jgi:hypothetical protein
MNFTSLPHEMISAGARFFHDTTLFLEQAERPDRLCPPPAAAEHCRRRDICVLARGMPNTAGQKTKKFHF